MGRNSSSIARCSLRLHDISSSSSATRQARRCMQSEQAFSAQAGRGSSVPSPLDALALPAWADVLTSPPHQASQLAPVAQVASARSWVAGVGAAAECATPTPALAAAATAVWPAATAQRAGAAPAATLAAP